MKKILSLFVLFLFGIVFSCQEAEDPVANDPDYGLKSEKSDVIPYEIVEIEVSGITNLKDSYEGKFAGKDILLGKASENSLVFIVPEVPIGKVKLELSLNNNDKSLEFTVGEGLEKVDGNEAFNLFFTQMDEFIRTNSSADEDELIKLVQRLIDKSKEEIAALSQNDKTSMASIIRANGLNLDLSIYANANKRSIEMCQVAAVNVVAYMTFSIIAVEGGAAALSTPELAYSKIFALIAAGMTGYFFYEIEMNLRKMGENCIQIFSFDLSEDDLFGSRLNEFNENKILKFTNGISRNFKLKGNYNSIDFSNPNSEYPFIREFIEMTNKFNSAIDGLNAIIGKLSNLLDFQFPKISEDKKVKFDNKGNEQQLTIDNPNLSIQNISNPNVKLKSVQTNNENISLAFEIIGDSEEEAFDFELIHTEDNRQVSMKVNALITQENDIEKLIIGKWRFLKTEYFDGTELIRTSTNEIENGPEGYYYWYFYDNKIFEYERYFFSDGKCDCETVVYGYLNSSGTYSYLIEGNLLGMNWTYDDSWDWNEIIEINDSTLTIILSGTNYYNEMYKLYFSRIDEQ